jgi:cytochrome b
MDTPETVTIWDPFVRIGHWTLVAAFAVAYITAGDSPEVHEWAGYVVAAYVLVRVVWGFIGSRHARFADFAYGPVRAVRYLLDAARQRSRRYLGHSPAGGAMVFLLLFMLAGTTLTGMAVLAGSHGEGPLSGLIEKTAPVETTAASPGDEPESALREIHELFANVTLILIALHLGGVLLASMSHNENLVRSMITGRKRR